MPLFKGSHPKVVQYNVKRLVQAGAPLANARKAAVLLAIESLGYMPKLRKTPPPKDSVGSNASQS